MDNSFIMKVNEFSSLFTDLLLDDDEFDPFTDIITIQIRKYKPGLRKVMWLDEYEQKNKDDKRRKQLMKHEKNQKMLNNEEKMKIVSTITKDIKTLKAAQFLHKNYFELLFIDDDDNLVESTEKMKNMCVVDKKNIVKEVVKYNKSNPRIKFDDIIAENKKLNEEFKNKIINESLNKCKEDLNYGEAPNFSDVNTTSKIQRYDNSLIDKDFISLQSERDEYTKLMNEYLKVCEDKDDQPVFSSFVKMCRSVGKQLNECQDIVTKEIDLLIGERDETIRELFIKSVKENGFILSYVDIVKFVIREELDHLEVTTNIQDDANYS